MPKSLKMATRASPRMPAQMTKKTTRTLAMAMDSPRADSLPVAS